MEHMGQLPMSPRRRRAIRIAAVAAGLLVAYSAFGFLVAPSILRRVLVKEASAALRREVTVAKLRVNPLALSVTIEGLSVRHRDGTPFVGWDSLYVRLAPVRLVAGDVGLAEIRLVRPSLHVGLVADGALTFQDLLAAEAPPAATPPAKKEEGRAISIGRLAVEEARVVFRDASVRPAFESTLGPLTVRLEDFRTRGGDDSPYSFSGTTDAGETFRWSGTVATQPLRSAGTLAFERIALPRYGAYLGDDVFPADLHDGLLDLETRYELEWSAEKRLARVAGGRIAVDRLAVGPRGVAEPAVTLPRIEVTGIEADVLAREAKVAEVALRGATVRLRREADGTMELSRMVPPPSGAGEPWTWSIGALAISGATVAFEDLTTPRPVSLPLTDVAVRLEQLRSAPDASSTLAASAAWAGSGKLAVKGSVKPLGNAGALELEASDLDLVPLAPYLAPDFAARLAAGRAGAKARIVADASGKEARWSFAGDVRLDGLAVAEEGNEDLLRWRALEISGIDAASTPPRASARLVRLVEPRAKLYVWEDGTTSVARARPAAAATAAPAGKPPPTAAAPAWRTAIGAFELVRGRAAFVDRSLAPAAVVNVTRAEARIRSLSSDPRVRSTVDVRLDVEGSPIRVAGTLNPLQNGLYTDLTVSSAGVDLSPMDPYAGKFLGYGIQKGKLDLDLRYKVEERNLAGANVVKVNQFTLGDATNSPDATKIPVRLALALLQDKDGVILLDVPVEGKLDDPEFRLGKVVWRAILNVLVKVATSPFRALAALVGGGDDADLSLVEFEPGTADPLASSQGRFAMLAASLAQRPALALELEGSADPERDGIALRRAALERALRRAKAATPSSAPASIEEVRLAPDERLRLVRAAYEAGFPPPPPAARKAGEAPPPPPTQQEMEDRLTAAMEVPADAFRSLAADRAQRAREALVAAGVDQARLFLAQGGGRAEKERGACVYFTLR
jgi:uncharacterized protein involved in outer membrane biogenesis